MKLYRKYFTAEHLNHSDTQVPNWGIDILTIGHTIHHPQKLYPDSDHPTHYWFSLDEGRTLDEFQLLYIANGQGMFESRDTPPTLITAGTAILLYPGVWHKYRPLEDTGWEEFWVGYKGHYAEYLMSQDCFSSQQPLIRIGFRSELLNFFTRLIDTLKFEGIAYQQMAACQVIQLLGLVYASALLSTPSWSRREQIVHQVRYNIQGSWMEAIDLKKMSTELNVSYTWFRKAFREVMGISPGQYHLNLKLEKAGQMLQNTNLSIEEIALKAGFESLFHFSRIFKKKMQVSPSEYRKKSGLPL